MRRFSLLLLGTLALASACQRTNPPAAPAPVGLDAVGPDSFVVHVATIRGSFDLKVHRDWSTRGADRLFRLVNLGFFDGNRFFRAVPNFIVQFGMSGDTAATRAWEAMRIADDTVRPGTVRRANVRGTLSFAMEGPDSRTTQVFINLADNQHLDPAGFGVVGHVVSGMSVVDSLFHGYGEGPPRGSGPSQERIAKEGEAYLAREFPKLDRLVSARITKRWPR